jgi:CBS domain containing-hemolysin-like protein
MLTELVIIILDILAIALFSFVLQHIFTYNAKIRIKNLIEENDALLKVNYKAVAKTDRQKNLIELQQKVIDDLSEELKQYRNSFNNN